MLTSYLPVYLYIYSLQVISLIIPYVLVQYIDYSTLPPYLQSRLPGLLWPLHWEGSDRESQTPAHPLEKQEGSSECTNTPTPRALLAPYKLISSTLHNITVLLTFGLCSPLLSLAIACTVFLKIQQWCFLIGRFCWLRGQAFEAEVNTSDRAIEALQLAVKSSEPYFYVGVWPLIYVSCLFFICLCWDMAGDKVGWNHSYWVVFAAIAAQLVVALCLHYTRQTKRPTDAAPLIIANNGNNPREPVDIIPNILLSKDLLDPDENEKCRQEMEM